MDTLVKALLIGGGAYVAYELFFAPAATPVAAVAAVAPVVVPSGPPSATTLAGLATVIQSLAATPNGVATGDSWNYYANQITGKTIPATWSNAQPMTFAEYWQNASPVIASMTGMSGLGGFADGLNVLLRAHRHGAATGLHGLN